MLNHFWLGIGAAIGLLVGMVLHEYAHARAALAAGDRTAKLQGRVTLNPRAHVDPLGTIIMPALFLIPMLVGKPLGMIFGYAKPVPVNHRNMRNKKWAPVLVALAGPATNFVIALVAGVGLHQVVTPGARILPSIFAGALTVNVFLGIINALPIPPLDGSRVLSLFLSPRAQFKLEEMSQYLILLLLVVFLFFSRVIGAMADPVCQTLSLNTITGCIL